MLENFTVAKFRFTISAKGRIVLPTYKGSTFRGGFGATFRSVVCTTKNQSCDDCIVKLKCPYSYIFETPPPRDTQIMRKYPHAPHPFVIEPPAEDKNEYEPGEQLQFGLVLIGKAIEYLPYFVYTLEELGKKGIGAGRGQYGLEEVRVDIEGRDNSIVYSSADRKLRDDSPVVKGSDFASGESKRVRELKLEFLTPVRIRYGDSYRHDVEFHVLIRNLLRRIGSLDYFHCGGEPGWIDYKGLIDAAKDVTTTKNELVWNNWDRYSKRQHQAMNLGGFTGKVSYRGSFDEFWVFLKIGELAHAGKGTTFGLGRYRIPPETDLAPDLKAGRDTK